MWTVDVAGSHQGGQLRGRIGQQFHRSVEPGGQWRGVGLEDGRSGQGPGACGRIPYPPIGPRVGHCHFQGVATGPDGVRNIHPEWPCPGTPARCPSNRASARSWTSPRSRTTFDTAAGSQWKLWRYVAVPEKYSTSERRLSASGPLHRPTAHPIPQFGPEEDVRNVAVTVSGRSRWC